MNPMRKVRGFALATAIFLLVILAGLGAFILNISTAQHIGQALDIEGERAWQAANAGLDWARYRVAADSACPSNTTWGSSNYSLTFAGTQTLTGMVATIECRDFGADNVAGVSTIMFEVRVTACNKPQASEPRCPGTVSTMGYVERQMQGLAGL